jgi:hypothetical protein
MSPAGPGTKINCAGEGQQQFPDPTRSHDTKPEDVNSNICRNAGNPVTFYMAYSRKQKSYIKLQPRKPKDIYPKYV